MLIVFSCNCAMLSIHQYKSSFICLLIIKIWYMNMFTICQGKFRMCRKYRLIYNLKWLCLQTQLKDFLYTEQSIADHRWKITHYTFQIIFSSENQSTTIFSMNSLSRCMVTVGLQQESFPVSIQFAIIQTLNKIRG